MSSRQQQERIVIDVNALMQRLSALEDYITALQATINRLNTDLRILYEGERALEELKSGEVRALVDIDGGGVVLTQAVLKGGPDTKVVIHAGLDIYVTVPIDKALEIIRKRQAETAKILDMYRRELARATNEYQYLRQLLEQVMAAARQQAVQQAQTGS